MYIFLPNVIPWKQLNQKIAEQKKVAMRIHDKNWQYRLLLFLSAIFIALSIWFIRNKNAPLQSINHLFLFLVLDIIYNTEDVTNTKQRSQKNNLQKLLDWYACHIQWLMQLRICFVSQAYVHLLIDKKSQLILSII